MRNSIKFAILLIGLFIFTGLSEFDRYPETRPYQFPTLRYFPEMPVSPDNATTVEGVDLGRHLFYDPILSADSSFSCSSCHNQKFAFSDSPNRFSKGVHGDLTKRNTLPLFNLAWYQGLFWDGKATSIEEQVFHPVRDHSEMDLNWKKATERISKSIFYREKFQATFGNIEIDSTLIAKAIAQFERTLISNNSKYDRVLRFEDYFTKEEYQGFVLINDQTKGDCLHCHTTDGDALGTTGKFSNNGLDAVSDADDFQDKGKGAISGQDQDMGLFRIPSLRNIAVTAPYMHDGRFKTLDEVMDFYSDGVHNSYNIDSKMGSIDQGGARLSKVEKEYIIAFLRTMTDSVFLNNPEFGNPFLLNE